MLTPAAWGARRALTRTRPHAPTRTRTVAQGSGGEALLNPSPASIWGSILSNMGSNGQRSPLDRSLSVFARSKSSSGDAGADAWRACAPRISSADLS